MFSVENLMFGKKTIKVDVALYNRLQAAAAQAGYSSTEEFVKHVLERETSALEELRDDELVKEQLRGLGYIE
jgi:ferritin-like metal-binding protein YciE